MIPVGLIILIILVICYKFFTGKAEQNTSDKISKFLKDESVVKIVPKSELNNIPFVRPEIKFANIRTNDSNVIENLNKLKKLEAQKLANFDTMTNKDLKMTYGVNNYTELLQYQDNYDNYTKLLIPTAELLISNNDYISAIHMLENGIKMNSNITKNYTLLGRLYVENNMKNDFFMLIDKVKSNRNLSQQKILNEFSQFRKG